MAKKVNEGETVEDTVETTETTQSVSSENTEEAKEETTETTTEEVKVESTETVSEETATSEETTSTETTAEDVVFKLGQIVHYYPNGGDKIAANNGAKKCAAIVTKEGTNKANVRVFPDDSRYVVPRINVPYGEQDAGKPYLLTID